VIPETAPVGAFEWLGSKNFATISGASEIAARTTPRFIEIKEEKRNRRPIVLGANEMRNVEKERERLLRLLEDD
jgi:hypothetical protein